jgi:hypothetical protein
MFGHVRLQSLQLSWLHLRVRFARHRELLRVLESAHVLVPCQEQFDIIHEPKQFHAYRKSHNLTVESYEPMIKHGEHYHLHVK